MRVLLFKSDKFHHRIPGDPIVNLTEQLLVFQGGQNRLPVLLDGAGILVLEIQQKLDVHIEDAGGRLGPFHIAAEPEGGIGDAA